VEWIDEGKPNFYRPEDTDILPRPALLEERTTFRGKETVKIIKMKRGRTEGGGEGGTKKGGGEDWMKANH